MSDLNDVKSAWSEEGDAPSELVRVTMRHPKPRTCNRQCPWLAANHDKTLEMFYDHEVPDIAIPEKRYAFAPWKRAQIWNDNLRDGSDGYGSLCHVRLPGTRWQGKVADVVARQCTGALVMQQRELLRHVERGESTLTAQGAARVAGAMLGRQVAEHELGGLDVGDLLEHAHPSLLDPKIGCDAVAPTLSEPEMQKWKLLRG